MDQRLKILFVVPSLSKTWGGLTTSVLSYYKGIKALGHGVHVVTVYLESELSDIKDDLLSNPDFLFYRASLRPWRYSRGLAKFLACRIGQFDIVHVHGMWTAVSYLTGRTAFKHAVPYIVSPHGMLESDALRRKALKKWIYLRLYEEKIFGRAALIHCINESERANVQRMFKVEQTSTIPNGICVSEFLGKDYQDLDTIAFIGRFHPKKGLDRLIEAVSMIPELKLWVAGSGEKSYESYISKIIDKYGMRNRVHVSGFVDEVTRAQIFRDTLFTVIPSFSEGLPMVALESLESGTPVIVSRQCNLQDVGEKVAGIIIDNNEPNTIKIAIEQMLSSDLARMSRNAHRLAKEQYELRTVASALVDAYLEVISVQSLRRA